ncbi:MAG: ABC transporter permease [bacterium]
MQITETLKLAFTSLVMNKLRSSLTILGIVVGIFSIISISTVIEMMQTSIEEGVSMLGQNTFQIQKFPPIFTGGRGEWMKFRNRKDLTLEEFYRLQEKLKDAQSVGAEQWNFGKIVEYGSEETNPNISISGVTPEAFPNNKWDAAEGRVLNNNDIESVEPFIVLGYDVYKKLFKYEDAIGKEVKIDGHKLRVIGVLEDEGAIFGESRGNYGIMPISTYQSFYGKRNNSINITVMCYDRESYIDVIEKAEGYLRTIRKVPPGEDSDFSIFSNESLLTQINDITSGVRIGSFVIAMIALLAAGVGIMNIMLVSVTDRTREIGIRKAVGAKRRNILFQFLLEAITLCLTGGIIGIALGVLVGNFAGSFLNASAVFPIDWIFVGVMMCVMIGIIFGTYPAYKASNLDPIEALRYE